MSDPQNNQPGASKASRPLAESLPEDDIVVPAGAPAPSPRRKTSVAVEHNSPEVEAALRQANLMRIRADLTAAERELRKALAADPASGAIHEMLGDVMAQAGHTDNALESYRRAQSCGAGPAVEGKIGRMLVANRPDIAAIGANTLIRGRGAIAMIASALIPGLGVALAGDMNAAAISFGGWIVTLALMFALPGPRALIEAAGRNQLADAPPAAGAALMLLVLGIANVGFWVYSLIVTARVAKPAGKDG